MWAGYLTWEWRQGLRSSIHPLIIAAFYKLAQVLVSLFFAGVARDDCKGQASLVSIEHRPHAPFHSTPFAFDLLLNMPSASACWIPPRTASVIFQTEICDVKGHGHGLLDRAPSHPSSHLCHCCCSWYVHACGGERARDGIEGDC